jgi:hypothetical protein
MDDIITRAKALLKLTKQQRKLWRERCDEAEAGDPFKEMVEVLQVLIKRCELSRNKCDQFPG